MEQHPITAHFDSTPTVIHCLHCGKDFPLSDAVSGRQVGWRTDNLFIMRYELPDGHYGYHTQIVERIPLTMMTK